MDFPRVLEFFQEGAQLQNNWMKLKGMGCSTAVMVLPSMGVIVDYRSSINGSNYNVDYYHSTAAEVS